MIVTTKFHSRKSSNRISSLCSSPLLLAVVVTVAGAMAVPTCHSFSSSSSSRSPPHHSIPGNKLTTTTTTPTTQLSSVGNWISGVTNIPPSSLLLSSSSPALATSLTESTSLQDKELACIYKGSKDGWSAVNFHRCVDEKGSCLVVLLTRTGVLMGGFNPVGWRSTDDYYNSNAAFLWYTNGDKAIKCPVLAGGNAAIFDYATGGPCFGSSDLLIGEPRAAVMGGFAGPDMEDTSINAGDLRKGKSGGLLAYREEGRFPARGEFSLVEVEVYCNAQFKDATAAGTPSWWPF